MADTNPAAQPDMEPDTNQAPPVAKQPDKQPATQGAAPGLSDATGPDAIASKTKVPQQYRASYLATIKAAISIVMNDKAHAMLVKSFQQDQTPVPQKLASGVLGLLQIVAHEAKGAMAPQVLVPAGTYLISWCGHFATRAGIAQVTDKDIATAIRIFMAMVVQKLRGQEQPQQQQQPGLLSGQQQPPQAAPAPPKMPMAPSAPPGANPSVGPAGGPAAGQMNPLGRV